MTPENEKDRYPFGKGFCACGCGNSTTVAKRTATTRGLIKGEPMRFVRGHNSYSTGLSRKQLESLKEKTFQFPIGYCQCGCGRITGIAKASNINRGHVKGQPFLYISGHDSRKQFHRQILTEDDKKLCNRCNQFKPTSDFYKSISSLTGFSYYCRVCDLARVKEHRSRNPETVRKNRRKTLLKCNYGMSVEDYDRLLKDQRNLCAICKLPHEDKKHKRLRVDHCHKTGSTKNAVRGLLCDNCNLGLGKFGDDPKLLYRAAKYLERHLTEP